MQRPLILVMSDHPTVFDRIHAAFEPDFEVMTLVPHAESVIAAAAILQPMAVIADLSGRSVSTATATARLLDEIPKVRLVALMDRERNPDVKRRAWLERGLEMDRLGPELAVGLERAFGGRVHALRLDGKNEDDWFGEALPEIGYSPTFSC